jgi:catechol 2,3-dioxygenase-like lactoylglutathione lyase family enzyme
MRPSPGPERPETIGDHRIAMDILVNIDVADLARAERFYTAAFDLQVARRFGTGGVELVGGSSAIYLLEKAAGSQASESLRQWLLPGAVPRPWLRRDRNPLERAHQRGRMYRYRPPETSMKLPVVYDAASDSSQSMTSATSSGAPPRCRGTSPLRRSTRPGSPPLPCMSV